MTKAVHKIIASVLIVSVLSLIINDAVFVHTHKMADGTAVTHAHPFNKSLDKTPYKSHHHTLVEIEALHHLSLMFLFTAFVVLFSVYFTQKIRVLDLHQFTPNNFSNACLGRAPPFSAY